MLDLEALEQIQELLDELRGLSSEGAPIVVEGGRDEKALRSLGVRGQVLRLSGDKRTALNFLEGLARYERVVIMTDFDPKGDELAEFCAKHLRRLGVEPVIDLREKLGVLLRKHLKGVEGLAKFIQKQEEALRRTRQL